MHAIRMFFMTIHYRQYIMQRHWASDASAAPARYRRRPDWLVGL